MNIDLSKFQEKTTPSIHVEGKLDKNSLDINGREISFLEAISYEGNIYKVDEDKVLHIDIDYIYIEACGRCLKSFTVKDSTVLSGKLIEETDEAISNDDEEIIFYKDGKLNLSDTIISTIILTLPMKPLCESECKGLCSKCGVDHNKEECECIIENVDPRFEKLKNFFPEE